MSTSYDISVQEPVHGQNDIKNAEEAIKRFREDDDPQTIFFLNFAPEFDGMEDLHVTKYSWATKIEQTVQAQYGKEKERHAIQLSWDRASYRAKLVDYLLRTTPWCIFGVDRVKDAEKHDLTGDYHHDKEVYKGATSDWLQASLPEVPVDRLQVIVKYIAETLALSQGRLQGVQRFAVALSVESENEALNQPGLRTVVLAFDRKAKENQVEVTGTLYEAKVNNKLLHQQKFDQKMLDLGKPLVHEWTLDIAA
ncbi:hypothetical protein COH20_008951 [Aspergillus flavus]|nr:hypothetical protein COH21_008253 [Aspergillus flavus]RAQ74272.1 hypothetical protein COH20_008951 [Aspergillus flavus]